MLEAVLVGCGAMSRAWLEAARQIDGLAIVGLVDIDVARARSRAAEFGLDGAAIGDSLDAMLDRHEARRRVRRGRAGGASLGRLLRLRPRLPRAERKAAGRRVADAHAMIAAARDAGRIHAVIQNRRYIPPIRRIRRLIDSGAIGDPTSIHCDFFLAPHFGGFRDQMEHVLLLDMAIHTFDAARAMTGPKAAASTATSGTRRAPGTATARRPAAIFEMSDGAVFTYRGSWCAEGARTSWEAAWRIVGERGSLVWDGHDSIRAEVVAGRAGGPVRSTRAGRVPPLDAADAIGGHLAIMQAVRRCRSRRPARPRRVSTDNLKSLAMVFGAIESAETGQRVAIEIKEYPT